ncbi:MAG: hypothetical protein FRX49_03260 [Trebouxia sp. A1-2]|nr:MAG: hypothetical protein FRX49_03260 [Trebouxia sp. A1-2]
MTSGLVCGVSLDIINSIDGRIHTIRCELVPDSGRLYRLDGKLRSGKEVKVFLKDRGIDLDQSCCLIRQAHVTKLADNNTFLMLGADHQQLAALIHDTSGYTRWSNEASAALEELKRTKKALQEISGNVKCLEAGVAEDEVKYGAAARLAQVDSELLDVQQDMADCLHARQGAVTQDILAAQGQLATLQEGLASQADRLEQLQQRGRQLQDPWAAAHTQDDQNLRSQRHLVVAAEEEVDIIEKQCMQAQQAMRQLEEAQAGSSDLQSQLDRLQQSLHSQQQFVISLEATIAGTNPATLAGLPGTDAQFTADAASTRGMLHQMDKALKQARQHSEECCRQAEMQKLALGSLMMLAQPGEP